MPIEIVVPRLGWSMEEGIFAQWLKRDGEAVQPGDRLYVLEGEKAATDIESFDSGTLHIPADAPAPGDTVKVTPWQEIQRGIVDQLADGMVLKPAVKYQRIAQKSVPRDNH